jgi:hypothetical protein
MDITMRAFYQRAFIIRYIRFNFRRARSLARFGGRKKRIDISKFFLYPLKVASLVLLIIYQRLTGRV